MPAKQDPYKGFRFLVEVDGIQQAGFSECSGLGSHVEVIEYREGNDSSTVRKFPGKTSYPDITLKWGSTDTHDLYDWHIAAVNGTIERKDGSVILCDDTGNEKIRWNFSKAWPSKWDGPSFNAKGNDLAIESLTLTCEQVIRG